MRALLQRVSSASVTVSGEMLGSIDHGLLVLLGVADSDGPTQVQWMARKLAGLRIFRDADGRMNRSLIDVSGAALVVSQFTLYGDCRKGRRPSFVHAGHPDHAEPIFLSFCEALQAQGVPVARGRFGAMMDVALINDGPVTLMIDSP